MCSGTNVKLNNGDGDDKGGEEEKNLFNLKKKTASHLQALVERVCVHLHGHRLLGDLRAGRARIGLLMSG